MPETVHKCDFHIQWQQHCCSETQTGTSTNVSALHSQRCIPWQSAWWTTGDWINRAVVILLKSKRNWHHCTSKTKLMKLHSRQLCTSLNPLEMGLQTTVDSKDITAPELGTYWHASKRTLSRLTLTSVRKFLTANWNTWHHTYTLVSQRVSSSLPPLGP